MQLELIFLGTGCAMPTKKRSLASVAIKYSSEIFLFDAPECVQKQIMKAGINFMKIKRVFISHWHADHSLGIAGLIATMMLHERNYKLEIYAPGKPKERIEKILSYASIEPEFEIEYKKLKEGTVVKEKGFEIEAVRLLHSTETYGFLFKEKDKIAKFNRERALKLGIKPGPLYAKLASGETVTINGKTIEPADVLDFDKGRAGRKVAIAIDTRPIKKLAEKIHKFNVLIHDAAFTASESERAIETMHSTASEAAKIAKEAECEKLYLINFSPRYKSVLTHLYEARKIFKRSYIARELETIKLPLNPEGRVV